MQENCTFSIIPYGITMSKIDSVLMVADKRKETKPYCRVLSLYGAFVPIRIAAGAMPKVDG